MYMVSGNEHTVDPSCIPSFFLTLHVYNSAYYAHLNIGMLYLVCISHIFLNVMYVQSQTETVLLPCGDLPATRWSQPFTKTI